MLSYNPYIAGNPVHGQGRFIGRSDIVRDVEQTLRNPSANALVLFGQRRIGKTSVLLHIEQELRAKAEFMPVYFDLQDKAALPLAQVLYQLAQVMAQITETPLPDRGQFDDEGQFFRETFMPAVLAGCHQRSLVVLLDEFDVLDLPQHERAGATFFPYLRDWMRSAQGHAVRVRVRPPARRTLHRHARRVQGHSIQPRVIDEARRHRGHHPPIRSRG
jgi:hypothetical protein